MDQVKSEQVKFRVVIELTIDLDGASVEEVKDYLEQIPKNAALNGDMTGETPATVDVWTSSVKVVEDVDRDQIEAFISDAVADGAMELEAHKVVTYGLMDPADFAAEMKERIELLADEAGDGE